MGADIGSAKRSFTAMDPIGTLAMFGKWPVQPGENLTAYEAMRDTAIVQFPPSDLLDFWHLRRAIDLIWEAMRYQRCTDSLIAITMKEALRRVLEAMTPMTGLEDADLGQVVEGWFRDAVKRIKVVEELRPYGFDEDTPIAMAMSLRSGELARFTEIRRRNEVQAAAHLREILRRREEASKPLLENTAIKADNKDGVPAIAG